MHGTKVSDQEVLALMVDGGRKICDHAISQWWNGAYGTDEEMQSEMIAAWKKKRERMTELADLIRINRNSNDA